MTMSTQVAGGLTTPSLWYDSQLRQAKMKDPTIYTVQGSVYNASTLQSTVVPLPQCVGNQIKAWSHYRDS